MQGERGSGLIRFSCLGNVSRKLISYGSYLWRTARESRLLMLLQYVRMSVCVREWVDIDLTGPQRWLTALTTCCYNAGQWGTCVCMWRIYCGTSEWNLPLWTDPCSHCIAWLTVRTWALKCLFPLLKMHLHRLFDAAERRHHFFYFLSVTNIAQLFLIYTYLDISMHTVYIYMRDIYYISFARLHCKKKCYDQ